jgi:hypothetical protein
MVEAKIILFRTMQFFIAMSFILATIIVFSFKGEMRKDGYYLPTLGAALWASFAFQDI